MSIRSEALPYVFPGALLAAAAGALGQPLVAVAAALASAALAAFFRDPERAAEGEASAVLSPADGRVVELVENESSLELAVFLSVFNVHVTRAPVSGALLSWDTITGGYAMAFRPEATHNARSVLRIAGPSGAVPSASGGSGTPTDAVRNSASRPAARDRDLDIPYSRPRRFRSRGSIRNIGPGIPSTQDHR